MMRKAIENNHLEFEITLAGSFCAGKCAGEGVTIKVDDEIISGVTKENFDNFFKENILGRLA
jgi:NADH:ubiquinone oxidoreductase subunit E